MPDRVSVSIDGGVADVRLNRPEKLNALDDAMFEALLQTGTALAQNHEVRAIVLSGEGRGFCAGLDFSSFMAMAGDSVGSRARRLLERCDESPANRAQRAAWIWTEIPAPVIAAIHGVVFGGGFQIAMGADLRIAAPSARLSIMEIRWGLIPDMSGTQTLRRLVRLDVVKELTFTGRIVEAREALALGLVTRLSDSPREEALRLAHEIAEKSPDAIRAGKRLLDQTRRLGVAEGLRLEEKTQLGLMGKPNQIEAVKANLQDRKPVFSQNRDSTIRR